MHKFDNYIRLSEGRSSLASAFYIIAIFFLGFQGIGGLLGVGAVKLLFGINIVDLLSNPQNSTDFKYPIYVMQSVAAITGLIVIPFLYLKMREGKGFGIFFRKKIEKSPLLITPILVISFMVVLSIIIEWNANITLPGFLSKFEEIARASEDRLAEMTILLTTFDSFSQFIIAMIVIAIIPSIGEEIVFRGLLQNELHTASKNPHVAIWLSAFVFSAIHMQFFGFFPRLLLGALFGYMYYWSGNLIVPILGHFVNNGFSLTLVYLATGDGLFGNLENSESASLPAVLLFVIITAGLIYFFRDHFIKRNNNNGPLAEGI